MIRRHSGSARLPSPRVGSLRIATRVIPSGTFAVRLVSSADDDVGGVAARFAVDRHEVAVGSEVVLHERAGREVRGGALLAGPASA